MTTSTTTAINPTDWSRALGFDQGQLRTAPTAVLTIAAQGSVDDRGRLMHEDDDAAQLALALAHVEAVLEQAGMRCTDLAQLHVYTTDLDRLMTVYDTLVEHLAESGARPPTTFLEVARLALPGMTVALEALAIQVAS